MKYLITGATGFVGSCLLRRLVEAQCEVHAFVRAQSNLWRIADLNDKITRHEVDLSDFEKVQKIIKEVKPDIIYHLAVYGGFAFQRETKAILDANLLGTVHLLQACEKVGFKYFVNTGSSSEYGLKLSPMQECDMAEPIGDYGVFKAAATMFCQSEARQKDLPIVTLRLFSPYGYWDDPKRLIPYVIKSLLHGEEPKLSTPESVRDYIFIDDVLDFYQTIVMRTEAAGSIFNVGSGRQHSIGEVVAMLSEIIDNGVKVRWGEEKKQRTEPCTWVADVKKARRSGLEINNDLKKGLEKTVSWMRGNIGLYL